MLLNANTVQSTMEPLHLFAIPAPRKTIRGSSDRGQTFVSSFLQD
jgi:hypothetical protein